MRNRSEGFPLTCYFCPGCDGDGTWDFFKSSLLSSSSADGNHQHLLNLQKNHKQMCYFGGIKKTEGYGYKLDTLNMIYYLLFTTDYLLLITYYWLLTTDYLLLTTYYLLLTIYYLLFTTYYSLPTTYYWLLTTYYLLRVCQNVYEYARMYTSMPECILI